MLHTTEDDVHGTRARILQGHTSACAEVENCIAAAQSAGSQNVYLETTFDVARTAAAGRKHLPLNNSFGTYKGSLKSPGWYWANPFLTKRSLSLRIRNFETAKLKVNDSNSNPIEIGAIVVWKVVETAEALFEVDDFEKYVTVQSESALRAVATSYPYDSHGKGEALSTHTAEVSAAMRAAVQERLAKAGIEVIETRISHLAYATEIAQAMLQRQQASAIVAARFTIVEGAVGMVENALELLSSKGIVTLDEERKAQMVSNLLVVLCSERSTQPVVNAGTLYG